MSVRDLIPWGREENRVPSLFRDSERDPFLSLHREVNRLFDDVFRGFDGGLPSVGRASAFGGNWPSGPRSITTFGARPPSGSISVNGTPANVLGDQSAKISRSGSASLS